MAKLNEKVEGAIEVLKEKGINVEVTVKRRIVRSEFLEITTTLGDSSKNSDIECAAEIEKAMRDALGYGTFARSYDARTRVMKASYRPLEKEASLTKAVSKASRSEPKPARRYRTAGTTEY